MRAALISAWLVLAVAGASRARADSVAASGICAACHATETGLTALDGGHAPGLDCLTCHEELRPGSFGPGHRAVPTSCTGHHATSVQNHPLPARKLRPTRERRHCLACHDPHGSTNAHLVRGVIRTRARLRRVDFHDAGGAVPGGFVDPITPGRGLCETCHRSTRFYPANGRGESHFTGDCLVCHDHAASFAPVITDASCAVCHPDQTARLAKENLHHQKFTGRCSSCHAEAKPAPGPGHRATSACADCHAATRVATHVPPGVAIPCAQCHEPHGTDTIRLLRDVIRTPDGMERSLHFDNLAGQADGSFASPSVPGTGLCEVCHTTTQFYRADGRGAPHFTVPCIRCHPHAAGFLPR